MYEALRRDAQWESRHPEGALFHVRAFDGDGDLDVVDVWESSEAMNVFVETRLMPAMETPGVPSPSVEVHPLLDANPCAGGERLRVR